MKLNKKIVKQKTSLTRADETSRKIGSGDRHRKSLTLMRGVVSRRKNDLVVDTNRFNKQSDPQIITFHRENKYQGSLLIKDIVYLGRLKNIGDVRLHIVLDSCSAHAFGLFEVSGSLKGTVALLHNDVLPFYKKLNLKVENILIDGNNNYRRSDLHSLRNYLESANISFQVKSFHESMVSGFVERFNQRVLNNFLQNIVSRKSYESLDHLQADLNDWLEFYNINCSPVEG